MAEANAFWRAFDAEIEAGMQDIERDKERLARGLYGTPTKEATTVTNHTLPTGSQERKDIPLARGALDYFPAALAAVAELSRAGNEKHNPGEEMHHARGKSTDHADCILRHLVDRGTVDPEDGIRHAVKVAWRALALLQQELEDNGAPLARGARLPGPDWSVPALTPAAVNDPSFGQTYIKLLYGGELKTFRLLERRAPTPGEFIRCEARSGKRLETAHLVGDRWPVGEVRDILEPLEPPAHHPV